MGAPSISNTRGSSAARDRLPRAPADVDPTDYAHQDFVNLLATAFLLAIAIGVVWSVKALDEYEKQRACLDSGRRECFLLDVPRHAGIRVPVR